jgi:transcriptional regulator
MYLPEHFKALEPSMGEDLIRAHPFASLISTDDTGQPYVSHLPLELEVGAGGRKLLGHVAKANPHWRHLAARPQALVTFQGPDAYMSPRVYTDLQRVPTWNYLVVHVQVRATLAEEEGAKDAILKKLIAHHDPAYAAQWRALPQDYTRRMLSAIVAFELEVLDMQCKFKLNQHRPEAHAAMLASYRAGSTRERELVPWLERLGITGQASKGA